MVNCGGTVQLSGAMRCYVPAEDFSCIAYKAIHLNQCMAL